MSEYAISEHATTRMVQRTVRNDDIELVATFGTQLASDAQLIKHADAEREISTQKAWIQRLSL